MDFDYTDGESENDSFLFELSVTDVDITAGGWVGLGWGPDGTMENSDFMIASYDGTNLELTDSYCENGHNIKA